MTGTILKPQATQVTQATRTIKLTIPVNSPDPKFNIGDRVIAFIEEDPEDPDVHAGIVTGISLEDDEWLYHVLPGDDKELRSLCVCESTDDDEWTWFEGEQLELLTPKNKAKAEWLMSEMPSYEEVRSQQLIFAKTAFPDSFIGNDVIARSSRREWNELIDSGHIPAHLGYMEV